MFIYLSFEFLLSKIRQLDVELYSKNSKCLSKSENWKKKIYINPIYRFSPPKFIPKSECDVKYFVCNL